jgi:Flp pilus assembly protein TadD
MTIPRDPGTVSLRELQHEVPKGALKQWNRGEKARIKEQFEKAAVHYQKALEVDPEFVAARNNLGAVLMIMNKPGEAATHLEECIRQDPHNPMAPANLAVSYLMLRRFEDAEQSARTAVDLGRASIRPRMILGLTLVMRDKLDDEALDLLSQAQDDFPQARLLTARIYGARGDLARAEAAVRGYLASGEPVARDLAEKWLAALTTRESAATATLVSAGR